MRRSLARIRGLGYIVWQARHMGYHVLLGLMWAWFLRERWGEFNPKWIWTAVIGSLAPDVEHISYFLGYGKNDSYTKQIWSYLTTRQWRQLVYFVATGHKLNTSLSFHNIYTVVFLILFSVAASFIDWQVGVVLFGAMVGHYLFDIVDDVVQLGTINANWRRWGRPR